MRGAKLADARAAGRGSGGSGWRRVRLGELGDERVLGAGARAGGAAWRTVLVVGVVVVGLLSPVSGGRGATAAPAGRVTAKAFLQPAWMDAAAASRLDLGFDVLVPGFVPAPFDGVPPQVSAGGGRYSLYWVVFGGPPTYLEITGTLGGAIPAYSQYDRNNQLVQNATVQGYPAYHDLTPIYDEVWWQAGGVVYQVSSKGMGVGSLALANALQVLTPPVSAPAASLGVPETVESGEVVSVAVDGASGATLTADAGTFEDTGTAVYPGAGGFAVGWRAPEVEDDLVVGFALTDPDSGETLATIQTTVLGAVGGPGVQIALSCPPSATSGATVGVTLYGAGDVSVQTTAGIFPANATNTAFDSNAGGSSLSGTVPGEGAASLTLLAPVVDVVSTVFVDAAGPSAMNAAECEIEIEPATSAESTAPPSEEPTVVAEPTADTVPTEDVVPTATAVRPGGGPVNGGPELTVAATVPLDEVPSAPVTVAASRPAPAPTRNPNATPPRRTATQTASTQPPAPVAGSPSNAGSDDSRVSTATTSETGTVPAATGTAAAATGTVVSAGTAGATRPSNPGTGEDPLAGLGAGGGSVPAQYPGSDGTDGPADPGYTGDLGRGTLPGGDGAAGGGLDAARNAGPDAAVVPVAPVAPAVVLPELPAAPPTVVSGRPGQGATGDTGAAQATGTAPATPTPTGTARSATRAATVAVEPKARATRRTATRSPDARGGDAGQTAGTAPAGSPTATASPTATRGPRPTPTAAADRSASEPVVALVGPAGGQVVHRAGAILTVPAGVLRRESTVTVRPVADSALPASAGTDLIPGTAFDVTVVGADGQMVERLDRAVTLRLALSAAGWRDGTVLIWVDGSALRPMDGSALDDGGVSAPLRHFSQFAAGVPDENDGPWGLLAWLVIAAVALVGLAVVGAIASLARRNRV